MTENGTVAAPVDLNRSITRDLVDRVDELSSRAALARALNRLVSRGEYDPAANTPLDDPAARPLSVAEYIELLSIQGEIARRMTRGAQADVRDALVAGATWQQVANAARTDVDSARAAFAAWVAGQAQLWQGYEVGLSPDEQDAARALLDKDQ